jgi:hypothetical protein
MNFHQESNQRNDNLAEERCRRVSRIIPRVGYAIYKRHALCAAVVLLALVGAADHSIADEQCQYPGTFGTMLVAPKNRLGEFRIPLDPPDYRSAESVRQHLTFSIVWARLLQLEVRGGTSNRCSTVITTELFPDLRAFLIGSRAAGNTINDLPDCERMLKNLILKLSPEEKSITAVSAAEARSRLTRIIRSPGAAMDADNLLNRALIHIYKFNTVMHALVSVDAETFTSLDVGAFRAWLESQRSSGHMSLRPLSMCGPEVNRTSPEVAGAEMPPDSDVTPPGVVTLTISKGEPALTRSLRHVVIVGHGHAVANTPLKTPATDKYCNRERTYAADGGAASGSPAAVTTRCLRAVIYQQSWTVFYCDPKDCASEATEKTVATSIAADSDVAGHGAHGGDASQPWGPYVVNVERASE